MPDTRPRVVFDENGVCNACHYTENMKNKLIDWQERENELKALLDVHRRKDGYWDCIIPWSGGKDSTANAIKLKTEYGMNPLLVTFNPLMPTEVGEYNRRILIEYGFDTMYVSSNVNVTRYLARRFFVERGNPKVLWDAGANCSLVRMATNYKIPLVFYSEHGETEYGGNKLSDKSDMTRDLSEVLENIIGDDPRNWVDDIVSEKDLNHYIYPNIEDVQQAGTKVVYMSYFFKWDQWVNYEYVKRHINFRDNPCGRTEGTFTKHDSLDDKIDDLYYYMQYVKFGFGRAVRDVSRMIQNGHMSREEGLELCTKYDGEFPQRYFGEVLEYLNLSESEFYDIVDKHRNKELWVKDQGRWKLRNPLV